MIESIPAVEIVSPTHSPSASLEVLFDGQCPVCSREVLWLQSHSTPSEVAFRDISSADFDPAPTGRSLAELMGSLHARTADGEWLVGAASLRAMYRAAGFRRLVAVSEWPVIAQILDLSYRLFAALRPYLRVPSNNNVGCETRCSARAVDE